MLVSGGLLAGLALAEGALRIAGLQFTNSVFYQFDPERGWALRPGAEGWQSQEGEVYIRINSRGLRDREHTLDKPPGVFRIAVLGDSFAEALQVPVEKTFWSVLERELASSCPLPGIRSFEVVNFGTAGYGTAQQLLTLRSRAWAYQPDLVLLAFLTGNDIYNNHRALNPSNPDLCPYFVYRGGKLALDESFRGANLAWRHFWAGAKNHSRLAQLIDRTIVSPISRRRAERHRAPVLAEFGKDYLDRLIYSPPAHPAMREAWRVTEGLLLAVRDEVQARPARFFLAILSNPIQVHPDKEARAAFLRKADAESLFYPDRRVEEFARNNGIPVLALAPPLLEQAEQRQVLLHGFRNSTPGYGHYNEQGHEAAGRLLAAAVCASLGGAR